jgi:hypothetical protein
VPEVGTDEPVIGKERWEEIRQMRAEAQSVSQIARATGLDRKTGEIRDPLDTLPPLAPASNKNPAEAGSILFVPFEAPLKAPRAFSLPLRLSSAA